MAGDKPVVYILHGEDEFNIARFLAELSAKLGDSTTASMNTSRLDGTALSIEELRAAAYALPFLASRRLVVVTNLLARLNNQEMQKKFEALASQIPATAAMVLVESRTLKEDPEKDKVAYWLLNWARHAGSRAFVRAFPLQKEGELAQWIQGQAKQSGGQITPAASWLLARMVAPDTRLAYQELQKLLAYVNYQRAIEVEDIETMSIPIFHEVIFALVDALALQDGKKASGLMRQFLEEEDPQYVLAMIARHFRLLLQAREVLDQGGNERDVHARLKLKHPRQAASITSQARRFSMETSENVYRSLLDIDDAVKSGRVEVEVALEGMAASFTTQ